MRRMITQKDQDYIKALSTALAADIEDGRVVIGNNVAVGNNVYVDSDVEVGNNVEVGGKITTNGYISSANMPLHSLVVKAYDENENELQDVKVSIFVMYFANTQNTGVDSGAYQKAFVALENDDGGSIKSIELFDGNGGAFCDKMLIEKAVGETFNDITSTTTTSANVITFASPNYIATVELLAFTAQLLNIQLSQL